ncbi:MULTISPECIES: AraC family transcriptional regulator [Streptomyces]|uniref:AraC family transcriptional regulator n=1 Tax=Streptomyces TaxID=1883 RepID=UPI0004CD71DB|nr:MULTISPECIES: helix-turn-helix domain-containing protein [Streptomyces]
MTRQRSLLGRYVKTLDAYDLGPGPVGVHRGLPSTTVSLTLPLDDPVEIGWAARSAPRTRHRAAVAGLHLDAAELRQRGCTRGVYVTLSPLGTAALLGLPASALAGHVADLADVAPALADLPERLAACRTWPQRQALVEHALLTGLARHGERDNAPELRAMLAALARTSRVHEAAELVGCSRRHLSGRLRTELGVTPKEYQRLVRFEAARSRLAALGTTQAGLADVAAAAGFADQAHLSREWRAMAGCAPTRWLRTEGPAAGGGPAHCRSLGEETVPGAAGAVPRCSRRGGAPTA